MAIADFHDQWLRVGELDDLEKEASLFAGWNANIPGADAAGERGRSSTT